MSRLWQTIEAVPTLGAVGAEWERLAENDFAALKPFLSATGVFAESYPCPNGGCAHRVIWHDERSGVAVTECGCCDCDDLPLRRGDAEVYQLNVSKLGRAIARGFGCDAKIASVGLPGVWQIATFSGAALPILLVIQNDAEDFRRVLLELVSRLKEGFVFLTPTNQFFDANSQASLRSARVGFFDLASYLVPSPAGELRSHKLAGELFSPFLPEQRSEIEKSEAQKVVAMLAKLRSERGKKKAPLFDVFMLLVMDGITQKQAARECDCSRGLMSQRVEELVRRFNGMSIETLKGFTQDLKESDVIKGDRFRKKSEGAKPDSFESADEGEVEDEESEPEY